MRKASNRAGATDLATKRRELFEHQIRMDERMKEVTAEMAELRATEAKLLMEIQQLQETELGATMHGMASLQADRAAPVAPRPMAIVRDADLPGMDSGRAAAAGKKPREGRPDTTGHALPAALGNIASWAEANDESEWRVRSWYAKGNAARKIPEKWAAYFEKGFKGADGKIHKIPRSAWTKGVRAD
jgi:hypothetical protein